VLDQVAWTTGEDGILALDVNGSGTIDNGSEIFSPWFPDGHPSSFAALASLDANGDGVMDAADADFSRLLVWQDLNHNGISEADELSLLADHGIVSISLSATAASGEVNGQELISQGTFQYVDGTSGTMVEVGFEAEIGSADQTMGGTTGDDILVGGVGNDMLVGGAGADVLTGGAGSDTFAFLGSDGVESDTITDFAVGDASAGGDVLDISDLLTDSGYAGDAATLQNFVSVVESGGNTLVSVDADGAGPATAQQIVTLQGVTNTTLQDLLNNNQIVA
ncbi:MAG: type I secretion C-terminal target domain-containing protein, partial [Betaproteobacteria bacterium]